MFVQIQTAFGPIKIKLEKDLTPKTVANFIRYIQDGFYNDTIFHRVIKGFMIQGGGLTDAMHNKKTLTPIENEADLGLLNKKGTIAMARTSDPHSASSQFFINLVDNAFLNFRSKSGDGWGYCAFGSVVEGMDVVEKIAQVPTTHRMGHDDVPKDPIFIQSIEILAEPSVTSI